MSEFLENSKCNNYEKSSDFTKSQVIATEQKDLTENTICDSWYIIFIQS